VIFAPGYNVTIGLMVTVTGVWTPAVELSVIDAVNEVVCIVKVEPGTLIEAITVPLGSKDEST
jgi:hypothetical protein